MIDANLMYVNAVVRHATTGERDTFTYYAERDEVNADTGEPVFADMSKGDIRTELLDRTKEQIRCLYDNDWQFMYATIHD